MDAACQKAIDSKDHHTLTQLMRRFPHFEELHLRLAPAQVAEIVSLVDYQLADRDVLLETECFYWFVQPGTIAPPYLSKTIRPRTQLHKTQKSRTRLRETGLTNTTTPENFENEG